MVGLTRDPAGGPPYQPPGQLARLGADPGAPAGRGLRGRRRRRQPARREDQPALDRRGQAADHGEPAHRHPQPGAGDRDAGAQAPGAGQPVGDRLLRRPRRRDRRRVGGAGRRVRRRGGARVGEGGARGRERRGAAGDQSAPATCSTRAAACSQEMLRPFKLGVGGPIAGGRQYMSWIHVDDEVGILLWALDDERVSGADQRDRPQPRHQRRAARRRSAAPSAARRSSPSPASSST